MGFGLGDGLRIAVVGTGPAGAAFGSALLASARAFGRRLQVVLYGSPSAPRVAAPVVLDSDARCRLASLGAALPSRPSCIDVQGVLLHAQGRSALLEPPAGGLWIVDGPGESSGRALVRQSLLAAAALRGAELRPWDVAAVDPLEDRYVVRAHGSAETYDLVAGAFGPASPLATHWMDGRFRPPTHRVGAHARVRWAGRDDLLRVCLAPTGDVDALVLVPCGNTAYALAVGDDVTPQGLARALMVLSRDRALPGGLQLLAAERVALAAGAARRLAHRGAVVLGSAAFGNLLDPGLLPTLISAMRTANAVLEVGGEEPLHGHLARSQADIALHARRQPKILRWARHAGDRAPRAFARVASESATVPANAPGLFGLGSLPSNAVLAELRVEGIKKALAEAFAPLPEPVAESPASGALVFVVDDDPDARSVLADFLRARGADVRLFDDEMALLEAAARERPAAVLLDVVLRWVDGFSLCRALRHHPTTARARIISMSSLSRRADRNAAVSAGADAFLPKPIDFDSLERLLAGILPAAAPLPAAREDEPARAHL